MESTRVLGRYFHRPAAARFGLRQTRIVLLEEDGLRQHGPGPAILGLEVHRLAASGFRFSKLVVQVQRAAANGQISHPHPFSTQCRQYLRVHRPHPRRTEEIVQEEDEPFQTIAARARETQQIVDVVEPVADLVSDPFRGRQPHFPGIALLHELLELGADVRGGQLRGAGQLLRQHRPPAFRETVEDLAGLDRQLLDPGLEIGRLFVDEPLQIFEGGPERRFDQHPTGEHQQPRVAARQPADGLEPPVVAVQGFREVRPFFTFRERFEDPAAVRLSETFEDDESKELVERLAVAADGFEHRVGGSEQHELRAFDQGGAKLVYLALVLELIEDRVQVLDEQDWPLPTRVAEVRERGERVCREPVRVSFVLGERFGSIRPSGVSGGAGQMEQGGQPEIRQADDPVVLLVERDGLPVRGKAGVLSDRVQETQPEGGLPHPARSDEHQVLARPSGSLFVQQAEYFREVFPTSDERRLQLVGSQLGRIVEPSADHGVSPLEWYLRHHSRSRFERNSSRQPLRLT